jgi:DNA-directed RNA polymerase specialized sigma24 family protein
MLGAMTTKAEATAALRAIDPALASILVQHDLDEVSMNEIAQSMRRRSLYSVQDAYESARRLADQA